jgi:hypothetical protein
MLFCNSFSDSDSLQFPDARLILAQRSVRNCVASFCSVLTTVNSYYEKSYVDIAFFFATVFRKLNDSTSVDVEAIGNAASDGRLCAQYVAVREEERGRDWQTVCSEVAFKSLIVDPLGAVRELYRRLQAPYEPMEQVAENVWRN